MSEVPTKKQDQFIVRFPDDMRDKIKESAEQNNRSMNAEIVVALEEWLARPSQEEVESKQLRDTAKQIMMERSVIEARLAEILSRIDEMERSRTSEKE
ncbi:Arc family DNA-binding protein [Sulfitobacter geojensis]|uniref:Arc family DNA-binding protein n=1 Tax=Sulfitobacter geojensis TaxID=1342299 RepID=UPI001F1D4EA4|nr:Arc family DNA-binding protein [Sulfitobacter geojensis]